MNRKGNCAPTRNSPCHSILGGLTQGQGVLCRRLVVSLSFSRPARTHYRPHSPSVCIRGHSLRSPWSSSMAHDRNHWYHSSLSGRSPCDVACAVRKFSCLIIVETVGITLDAHLDCILFLVARLEPLSGITSLHMGGTFLLEDSCLVRQQ